MTKSEFLAQLRKALQGNLNSSAVQENMEYYERSLDSGQDDHGCQ